MIEGFTRRAAIGALGSAAVAAPRLASAAGWDGGNLVHLIPTADHQRIRIKASFRTPLDRPPVLHCSGRQAKGVRGDSAGRYWRFDIDGLAPGTRHRLELRDIAGRELCSPWPLATFPDPAAHPERLRVLVYTCAGGDEALMIDGEPAYLPLEARRALLARALSLAPDAVIANGDHVYYDERTMLRDKAPPVIAGWRGLFDRFGMMDRASPALGTANEAILLQVGERQIAGLYGTMLRSTPSYFVGDDHDLFDNDEANSDFVTLPPDEHMLDAGRAIQRLFYPELLGADLPVSGGGFERTNEAFGSLRYGRLFEALIYDTKRFATLGAAGGMIPRDAEAWLARRTGAADTRQLVHVPSTPFGWSAGKWGEWYPDILGRDGRLTTKIEKPQWPSGWWGQHQRLLAMLAAQPSRAAVSLSGDLHMLAAGAIVRSGGLDFSPNPVHSIVTGPLGTGLPVFPSTARGVLPAPPQAITLQESVSPLEKDGFTILDVTPGRIEASLFAWRPSDSMAAIAALQPVHRYVIPTRN